MPYSSVPIVCPVCERTFPHWRTNTTLLRGGTESKRIPHSNYDLMVNHVMVEHPGVFQKYMQGDSEGLCDCGNCVICAVDHSTEHYVHDCKCNEPDCTRCSVRKMWFGLASCHYSKG